MRDPLRPQSNKTSESPWKHWYTTKKAPEPDTEVFLDYLGHGGRLRILDLGCGAGRHIAFLSSKGHQLYGVDPYPSILEEVASHGRALGFKLGLAAWAPPAGLPFRDRSFDAVVATRSIHHGFLRTVRFTFNETRRVMTEKGLLLLQVPSYEQFVQTYSRAVDWKEPGTLVAAWGAEKGVPHHYFTRGELEEMLSDFETIKLHGPSDHYGGYCVIARKTR
ncbi:MAG: class I SAM-dependent methyltransferase [Thermoprotei archaeon]